LKTLISEIGGRKTTRPVFHISYACKLANELLAMKDDAERWKLMYHVWLGMLCYSASMCRGYLHAKSLGEGGEFLSLVWLVLSLKGSRLWPTSFRCRRRHKLLLTKKKQARALLMTRLSCRRRHKLLLTKKKQARELLMTSFSGSRRFIIL
jgi:hypothetical protein